MFELKSISKGAVGAALEKAHHYRVLNEPVEAESICRDVLEVEPRNQDALTTLLLALSDQFPRGLGARFREARELIPSLKSEYHREYYSGILCERRAKCQFQQGIPGCGHLAYEGLREAMGYYERAEAIRPEGHDDPLLRWNACARLIMRHPEIMPEPEIPAEPLQLE